jgi:DNA modification methylase
VTLHAGDCLALLDQMPENSVDSVCVDPPYELGFMGRAWDRTGVAFDPATWARVLRVLKPGGHMLAFAASKNSHRMICAIEDAGFEVRETLMYLYGSGFPKSLNPGKAALKHLEAQLRAQGVEGEIVWK